MKVLGIESFWTPKGYDLCGCVMDSDTGDFGYVGMRSLMPHANEIVDRITEGEKDLLLPDHDLRSDILREFEQPFAPLDDWVRWTQPAYVIFNSHPRRSYRETSWSDGGVFSKVCPRNVDVLPSGDVRPIVRQFNAEKQLSDVLGYTLNDDNLTRNFRGLFDESIHPATVYAYALAVAWHKKK